MNGQTSSTPAASPQYVVVIKSTRMPHCCWGAGSYRKVALIRLAPGATAAEVTMLSPRCRAIAEIVELYDRVQMGATPRSSGYRLLRDLEAEADRLNAQV